MFYQIRPEATRGLDFLDRQPAARISIFADNNFHA
jgi:hypothetical protein